MKFKPDTTGRLERYFRKIIKEHFPELENVNILYAWAEGKKKMEAGQYVLGMATRLSNKQRDLFGYDFVIEIYKDMWKSLPEDERYKLAFHELMHCGVEIDEETNEPVLDNEGRVKIYIRDHDIHLERFKKEIEVFGMDSTEYELYKFLSKHSKTKGLKNGKSKKKTSKKAKKKGKGKRV